MVIPCCPTLPLISFLTLPSSYFFLALILFVPSSEAKSDLFHTPTFPTPPFSFDLAFCPLSYSHSSCVLLVNCFADIKNQCCVLAASLRFVSWLAFIVHFLCLAACLSLLYFFPATSFSSFFRLHTFPPLTSFEHRQLKRYTISSVPVCVCCTCTN